MMWLLLIAQVIALDIILSGDNAVVIAGAANTLPHKLRNKALFLGIALALVVRIAFVAVAGLLLHVKILSVAGGLLLFWIAYRMVRPPKPVDDEGVKPAWSDSMFVAIGSIVAADVVMSLDNVVAVAGLTRGHPWAMIAGLALSVAILGAAAKMVSLLLNAHKWISWIGAALVAWVGLTLVL